MTLYKQFVLLTDTDLSADNLQEMLLIFIVCSCVFVFNKWN